MKNVKIEIKGLILIQCFN